MRSEPVPSERIVLVASLVVAGVALSSLAVLPSWPITLQVLGSELGVHPGGRELVIVLLVLLTAAGIDALVRAIPDLGNVAVRYTITAWMLPCLVTVAAATTVASSVGHARAWLSSLVGLGVLLLVVVLASYGTLRVDGPFHRTARLGLNVATYLAAFALYRGIYGLQVRSILSATAVVLVTFPLALELLRGTEEQIETTWLYGFIVAIITGEVTWVLNALGLSAAAGGALLLTAFYTFSGISQQHLAGRLNRRVALEFFAIALIVVSIIWLSTSWQTG